MWAERGAESTTLATGQIQLQPNPRTLAAGADTRSTARKALEDLKAAVAAWNPMRKAYTIAGRSMEFNSVAEILKLINHFESQVAAEDQLAGRAEKLGRRIFTRI
jgi:phosphoribosylaminoimidazole carboxylase (NCAIR synthetase)